MQVLLPEMLVQGRRPVCQGGVQEIAHVCEFRSVIHIQVSPVKRPHDILQAHERFIIFFEHPEQTCRKKVHPYSHLKNNRLPWV